MTIINQTYKFIFVHIPKNGGTTATSVFSTFTHWCDIELGGTPYGESFASIYLSRFGIGKHSRADLIQNVVGAPVWDRSFKFAFVRDPYSRTYSIYRFLKKWKNWQNSEIMDQFADFEAFVTSPFFLENPGPDGMFNPQYTWVTNANGQELLNYVGKIEEIKTALFTIFDTLKLVPPDREVPRANASGATDEYITMYNSVALEIVRKKYERDFDLFGYEKALEPISI